MFGERPTAAFSRRGAVATLAGMAKPVFSTPADTSALVQHFLLYHGARHTSRTSEENWKHVAVSLQAPDIHLPTGELGAGTWLVVPWDEPTIEQLEAWLNRVASAGPMPRYVVVTTGTPTLPSADLGALSLLFGTDIIGIDAPLRRTSGSGAAQVLQGLYAADQLQRLGSVNPLERLGSLGDPRDPDVFFERLRRTGRGTPVTLTLMGLNILVFLGMTALRGSPSSFFATFDPDLLRLGGANIAAYTVGQHETWRLLSCTFVHANALHIAMNMYVLKSVGETAERLFGARMFIALYLLAGIGGSIASLAWTLSADPQMPSVGASGAVFGVMGGLLGFALSRRRSVPVTVYRSLLRMSLMFTVINIGLGLQIAQIDNAAHIGGLVTGLVAGTVLSRDLPPAPQPSATQRIIVLAACFGGLGLAYQLAAQLVTN